MQRESRVIDYFYISQSFACSLSFSILCVLWFFRNPNAAEFHPLKTVLGLPVFQYAPPSDEDIFASLVFASRHHGGITYLSSPPTASRYMSVNCKRSCELCPGQDGTARQVAVQAEAEAVAAAARELMTSGRAWSDPLTLFQFPVHILGQ